MGYRRKSRELALQALFFMETKGEGRDANARKTLLDLFCQSFEDRINKDSKPFFISLVNGVLDCEKELNPIIEEASTNWKLSRMPAVDRNILRIGTYELVKCKDIPAKVTINEAVEISKKFCARESASFINGILDKIRVAHKIE